MDMTEVQLFVIATLATIIVYLVKAAMAFLPKVADFFRTRGAEKAAAFFAWLGVFLTGRGFLTVLLFGVSIVLALAWNFPIFPPFPIYGVSHADNYIAKYVTDLINYLIRVLETVSPVVAFATLIYNVLGKQVFDKLAEKFGAKK